MVQTGKHALFSSVLWYKENSSLKEAKSREAGKEKKRRNSNKGFDQKKKVKNIRRGKIKEKKERKKERRKERKKGRRG